MKIPAGARGIVTYGAILVIAFLLAYAGHVGHGFIQDDVAWILHGRVRDSESLQRALFGSIGFYRPVVTLSFGFNDAAFGTWSLGYGITNLALALACGAAVFVLAREAGLQPWSALAAAGVWAFNVHGINMAVLWLSGRTALLLTLFSLLAVLAMLKRRPVLTCVCAMLALCSKEEAVALPFICVVWAAYDPSGAGSSTRRLARHRWVDALKRSAPAFLALGVYAVLRSQSGAFTPQRAPSFYQFTFDPADVFRNVVEYADRSMTFAVASALLLFAYIRQKPVWSPNLRAVVIKGLVWLLGGYVVTVWLPVRSSLYAVWPSVGASLIVAAFAQAVLTNASPPRLTRVAAAACVVPFLLLPVYWSRNVRWVELADLSSLTAATINAHAASIQEGSLVELRDDRSTRANFANAFGTLFPDAGVVFFGDRYRLWIDPPPPEVADLPKPAIGVGAVFQLENGQLLRIR